MLKQIEWCIDLGGKELARDSTGPTWPYDPAGISSGMEKWLLKN
jgi:hypothetical protein